MKRYNYEPGNATRYDLVYGRIEGTKQYVLAWLSKGGSGGTALQWEHFDDMPSPEPGYIASKMQLAFEGDAVAIAQFIESHHPSRVTTHTSICHLDGGDSCRSFGTLVHRKLTDEEYEEYKEYEAGCGHHCFNNPDRTCC